MRSKSFIRLMPLVLAAALLLPGATPTVRVRPPVNAGTYYPADAAKLREVIRGYFEKAGVEPMNARLVACIAPHSAFGFSGAVAAHAFKELRPGQYDRVIVIAPSNFATFPGCSVPAVEGFATPLGVTPLAGPAIRQLCLSPQVTLRTLRYDEVAQRSQVHEKEHAIEVLLPLLQERLGYFELVPILVGDLSRPGGEFDVHVLDAVAEAIRGIVTERTLIVASSNFTQYGEEFQYVPFRENIVERIKALDDTAFSRILARDAEAFRAYLRETRNPIGGQNAILLLLRLLPKNAFGRVVAYDTSGRMTGMPARSVSYAAIDFHDLTQAPLPTAESASEPKSDE
ncbi:MAG TPA: AmmeMemoRadiSam system protein B [Candidatus Hydrogenedentes bacterium]|nr:AmmeMemoRadiSam system protein B [Candidatus Hydrogenedentota bacterium]